MQIGQLLTKLLVGIGKPIYRGIAWLVNKLKSRPAKKSVKREVKEVKVVYTTRKPSWIYRLFRSFYLVKINGPVSVKPKTGHQYLILSFIILSFVIYLFIFRDLPSPTTLTTQPVPLTTHIRDRNGVTLYKFYKNQNRTLVKLSEIPKFLKQATIAIEDKKFYSHAGFSITGTLRAILRTTSGKQVEGGSTITQQLVKTALLSPERTLRRKIRELVLAMAVEILYSKDQILEMYLNRVSYGGETYGVEEAAQVYFGKPVEQLTLAEASLLAGLPASPTTYSPFGSKPELAKNRQKEVLRRMVEDGYISWDEAQKTSSEELHFMPQTVDIKAPHFVMYVRELLAEKYGADMVEQGGLDVTTSLDLNIQEQAEKIVKEETAKVAWLHIGNGAALVTNPNTGEILAMIGSRDYFDTKADGNVNVTRSLRQPGSSIKPINYALSFMNNFTPGSIIDDSPITYNVAGQPSYSPVNYDGKFHGKVTLRTALASSYNIPAVKLLAANGIDKFINLGQKMGITSWDDPSRFGLSLTLGGGEVTMLDMAKVFGVFANAGLRTELQPILLVHDSKGKVLEKLESIKTERIIDPKIAYLISDILSDNSARAPAFGYGSDLFIPGAMVAVKTGTTNNLKDNWTIGYTPNRVVAVWVGNNDNSSMSYVASGVTGASPIWRKIMNTILDKQPPTIFTPPSDLVKVNICIITGELACAGCPTKTEFFIPGTQPTIACNPEVIKKIQEDRDKLLDGAKIGQ